eukprot:scaffold94179_cov48-Phaeocystis_antarctica.AAC.1
MECPAKAHASEYNLYCTNRFIKTQARPTPHARVRARRGGCTDHASGAAGPSRRVVAHPLDDRGHRLRALGGEELRARVELEEGL